MTIVLVHGNPEVAAIWDDLIDALAADGVERSVVALSPPGFGGPVPEGFTSTMDEYADWLVGELEQLDAPIHLIGHDWGGGHVINAMVRRPDLMASVTTDVAGIFAPGYQWHDAAQVWRTPDAGEEAVAAMAAIPRDDRIALFVDLGMNPAGAAACADAGGEMGPHILALYRSADEALLVERGQVVAAMSDKPPIHVVLATEDHYTGGEPLATATAEAWGAKVHRLEGLGHWWMLQDAALAAELVRTVAR